jgi:sugar/nucleoside kinase (ribokinase family)
MKITVIGHLCLDVIQHPDGSETQSYGGIFFAVATLANLLGPGDTVAPVFGVGKADYDALTGRLKAYPNVDRSGIYQFNGPTNQVRLIYSSTSQRTECSKHISEPIPLKRIRPHLDADLILVNMISGFDVTLDTFDEIRVEVRDAAVPLYLDVHSLTLGIKEDFIRFHRPVELWRRWLFMVHAAQLNEEEAAILSPEHLNETSLANHTLALDTQALLITRGERGCTAFIDEHKHTRRVDVPGLQTASFPDPTGCGDVFGAAYCAHYARTKEIESSVNFANRVASLNAGLTGSEDIDKISSFRLVETAAEQAHP